MVDLIERITKVYSLEALKKLIDLPATVIDVGVQQGTRELYDTFPEAHHLLIEPVEEHESYLQEICKGLSKCSYAIAAATNFDGEINLSVTPNRMYAAVTGHNQVQGREVRPVRAAKLDTLCEEFSLEGPYLVKIDTDGHELSVLEGSANVLKDSVYVVIESTLFIQFHDVIDFMRGQGFVVYDILEPLYRPLDGALWQVDLAFVPEDSPLREVRRYATQEQFKKMTGAE